MTPLDQLALTVIRNAAAVVIEQSPIRLVLEVPRTYPRWLGPLPRVLGAKRTRKIHLDGTALLVWRRIDDRTDLGGLVDWFAAEQNLGFNEARLIVLQFLRSLAQRGLVVLGDRTRVSAPVSARSAPSGGADPNR
jgi:hypothetical protein